jgi:asparagine synthase (glutamine-hydrolysing)
MCGIFGFVGEGAVDLKKARKALHTLAHRGPDQWSDFANEGVYFGHRRLSIIDLSEHGRQPMTNAEGNLVITVNGEIYNFRSLRDELKTAQYEFSSDSDSEVILHGFKHWGIDGLLERIEGMFAFSIFDRLNRVIYLGRDRVGIKPLYYARTDNYLSWASELKALRDFHPQLEIDNTALYDFLTYQYIPCPKTLYRNCFKLEPAHYLRFDLSSQTLSKKKYWSLDTTVRIFDKTEGRSKVYEAVNRAVKEQMVSDVPVGFFLSGGIDSSIMVASASLSSDALRSYTIGFTDKNHDETHFAEIVAGHVRTQHHKQILDGDTINELFPHIRTWYDEPFADLSCFPSFLVASFAKKDVTVVLTGDGGDEIFGGYKWYRRFLFTRKFGMPKTKWFKNTAVKLLKLSGSDVISKYGTLLFLDDLECYTKLMGGLLKEEKKNYAKSLGIPHDYDDYWYFRKFYKNDLPMLTRLQYLDFHTYLPDDILTKVDRVSMAVALECRVPLLATEVVNISFSLHERVRFQKYGAKGVLKAAFESMLPERIINRGKRGFSIPVSTWSREVKGPHRNRFQKVLEDAFGFAHI